MNRKRTLNSFIVQILLLSRHEQTIKSSIKIKIKVDTCPPLNFNTEQILLIQPHSFMTRCFTLPDLFAGKMLALVYRTWKNRVMGVIGMVWMYYHLFVILRNLTFGQTTILFNLQR